LSVVYEDDQILVINKEAGLAVQGGERVSVSVDDLLPSGSATALPGASAGQGYLGAPPRGQDKGSGRPLFLLFAGRGLRKIYLAVCAGRPASSSGTIRDSVRTRCQGTGGAHLFPRAGFHRRFQPAGVGVGDRPNAPLRVHLAGIGNPILGDDKYGDFTLNKRLKKERGLKRMLLHAYSLQILAEKKAAKDGRLSFLAPPPSYFLPYIDELGLSSVF
jgi:23S rRNA pseudouridine955/2504/2580 synthase